MDPVIRMDPFLTQSRLRFCEMALQCTHGAPGGLDCGLKEISIRVDGTGYPTCSDHRYPENQADAPTKPEQ